MAVTIDPTQLQGALDQSEQQAASAPSANVVVGRSSRASHQQDIVLDRRFNLDTALEKAYNTAQHYMNKKLALDDMELVMEESSDGPVGVVQEQDGGKKLMRYEGHDLLRAYAHNHQTRGVVVDGIT